MQGNQRRDHILNLLNQTKVPISASSFARTFHVSRQIIVGDIALLRALGHTIESTPKGYLLNHDDDTYESYQVIVKHQMEETRLELELLVDHHMIIKDVIVNHPLYGIIKGDLNIKTRDDIETFFKKNTTLLSNLTDGIHIHTLLYQSQDDLKHALDALKQNHLLFED